MKRVPSEKGGPDKESLSKWELSRKASDGAPSENWKPWLGRYPEERASGGRQWKRGPSEGTLRKCHDESKHLGGRCGGGRVSNGIGSGVRASVNLSRLLSSRLTASPWAAGPRMDF